MQQAVGESGRGLEGVAEGVAEIEQRALAGLALVARRRSPALPRQLVAIACSRAGAAGKDIAPIGLQPGEERGVAEQPVFRDLGVAGAELARRQRVEERGVGEHQDRLMERADQILAVARN